MKRCIGALYRWKVSTSSTRLRASSRRERLEVGDEVVVQRHIEFGLRVEAAMLGVVRALEQPGFAVGDDLAGGFAGDAGLGVAQQPGRHGGGNGDVVGHCTFCAPMKSCRTLNTRQAPSSRRPTRRKLAYQMAAVEFQFVRRAAIDHVDIEMLAPVVAPFRPVEALDDERQREDVRRHAFQPGVVCVGVFLRRRQHADHRAQRAVRREQAARIHAAGRLHLEAGGIAVLDQRLDLVEIVFQVLHDRTGRTAAR